MMFATLRKLKYLLYNYKMHSPIFSSKITKCPKLIQGYCCFLVFSFIVKRLYMRQDLVVNQGVMCVQKKKYIQHYQFMAPLNSSLRLLAEWPAHVLCCTLLYFTRLNCIGLIRTRLDWSHLGRQIRDLIKIVMSFQCSSLLGHTGICLHSTTFYQVLRIVFAI